MIQENTMTLLLERHPGKDVGIGNKYFRVGKQLKVELKLLQRRKKRFECHTANLICAGSRIQNVDLGT